MNIALICAASDNGVIGVDNRLPWHVPADLKYFKAQTLGHSVIMGRKTFESFGKPLAQRRNIVVSRQQAFKPAGVEVVHALEEAYALCAASLDTPQAAQDEVFVIGGAEIYAQALADAQRIYLTRIHHDFQGDTKLFTIHPEQWLQTASEHHEADALNPYAYTFLVYERQNQNASTRRL